jgi:hypothetical protein
MISRVLSTLLRLATEDMSTDEWTFKLKIQKTGAEEIDNAQVRSPVSDLER